MSRKIKDLGDDKPKCVESFEQNHMYMHTHARPRTGGYGYAPTPAHEEPHALAPYKRARARITAHTRLVNTRARFLIAVNLFNRVST